MDCIKFYQLQTFNYEKMITGLGGRFAVINFDRLLNSQTNEWWQSCWCGQRGCQDWCDSATFLTCCLLRRRCCQCL